MVSCYEPLQPPALQLCASTHLLRVSVELLTVPMKTVWNSLLARSWLSTCSPGLY